MWQVRESFSNAGVIIILLDTFQEVLQLPPDQLANFVHEVAQPELRDLTKCEYLCDTFKEDLTFHSSLSLQSLMVSVIYCMIFTIQATLQRMAQNLNVDVAGMLVGGSSNHNYLLPLIGITGCALVRMMLLLHVLLLCDVPGVDTLCVMACHRHWPIVLWAVLWL